MKPEHPFRTRVSIVLCAAFLAACAPQEEPANLVDSGKRHLDQGDAKSAIVEFKAALQKRPDLAEARFLLGQAYLKSDDVIAAEKEFGTALELGYSVAEINPELARVRVAKGEFQEAIRDFSSAPTASARGAAELHSALGEANVALGNLDAADDEFHKSEAADPSYAWSYLASARLAAKRGDIAGALKKADRGIEVAPREPDGWVVKGWVLGVDGRPEDALQAYRKAIELKPDFAPARAALISALVDNKRLDQAATEMEQLKKIAPKAPQTMYLEAVLNLHQGSLEAARNAIQDYQRMLPNDPSAAMLAADIYFKMHSYARAESNLLMVLRKIPNNDAARRMLVGTYLATGDIPRAFEAIQPMLNRIGGDTAMLNAAGEIFLRAGQPKVAAEFFKQAAVVEPAGANQRTGLALTHVAQGELSAGTKELEAAAKNEDTSRPDVALIALALKQRDYEKAMRLIDALEKKNASKALATDLRGLVLLGRNDKAGARKSFEQALATDPAFVPALLNLVRLDIADHKPDDAQRRLEVFVRLHPNDTKALLALAELRNRANAPIDDVVHLIQQAISSQPDDPEPRLALVNYYLLHNEAKRAVVAAQEAAVPLRDEPEMVDALARAQVAAGETQQAILTYGRLTQARPNSAAPLIKLAELQRLAGDSQAAVDSLERAVRLEPRMLEAQRPLIGLHVAAQRWRQALAIAQNVQKQRPKEAIGYLLEGDVYAAQQAWPEALDAYRTAVKQSGASFAAVKLHHGLLAAGRSPEANAFVQSWLHDHPDDAAFRLYYADNAAERGEPAVAAEQYRALLRKQPDNPILLNNLAWVAAKANDPKALEYAEKASELAPDQAKILDTLGVLLVDKGETPRAVQTLARATGLAPADPSIRFHYAQALLKVGDKVAARRELDTLTRLGDRFPRHAEVAELLKAM